MKNNVVAIPRRVLVSNIQSGKNAKYDLLDVYNNKAFKIIAHLPYSVLKKVLFLCMFGKFV